jgi:hypothetical protein
MSEMNQPREALPMSMRYALQSVDAVPSTLTLRRFDANNGASWSPAGANEIRIPVQADGFLDVNKHYLYMTIENTDDAATHLQYNIGCIIEQLRIESQGVELERIDRYNLLNAHAPYWNGSLNKAVCMNSILSGGGEPTGTEKVFSVQGPSIANATTRNYTLALDLSGFLSHHHNKALPQGIAQFEIIIRLQDAVTALKGNGTAPAYTITNARFYCPVYTIDDSGIMNQYRQMVGARGVNWTGDTYKTYINALTDTTSTQVLQINDRSSSLLALISFVRTTANIASKNLLGLACATLHGVDKYHYQIGGVNYPQSGIDVSVVTNGQNLGRIFNEGLKAFASDGYPYGESLISLDKIKQTSAAGSVDGADASMACIAVDLKRFDDNRLSLVGLNTAKNSVPNTLEIQTTAGNLEGASDCTTYAKVEAEFFMAPDGRLSVAM